MRKKLLFALSALLLLGGTALAQNVARVTNAEVDQEYATINAAFTEWDNNGGTLKLLKTCEFDTTSMVTILNTRTLDLNGCKLTWKSTSTTNNYVIDLSKGNLTVDDNSANKNGELELVSSKDHGYTRGIYIYNYNQSTTPGSFTMNAGTLAYKPTLTDAKASGTYALYANGKYVTVSLKDCKIELRGYCNYGIQLKSCNVTALDNVNVVYAGDDSKSDSVTGIYLESTPSTMTISNLSIDLSSVSEGKTTYPINLYGSGKTYTLSDNVVLKGHSTGYALKASSCTTNIVSGIYEGKVELASANISGGQFSVCPNAMYAATGYIFQYDGTKYWTLVAGNYIAYIHDDEKETYVGHTNEEDLWNACSESASDYSTVYILPNNNFNIPEGKYAGINQKTSKQANGNITNGGNMKISSGIWSSGTITNNGDLKITYSTCNSGVSFVNNGTLTISGGTYNSGVVITINPGANTILKGGTFAPDLYNELKDYVADRYMAVLNAKGNYEIKPVAATVDGVPYDKLDSALKYSSAEHYAILQNNISQTKNVLIENYSPCYLDMNGYNIAFSTYRVFQLSKKAALTITGSGTISAGVNGVFWIVGNDVSSEDNIVELNVGKDVICKATYYVVPMVCEKTNAFGIRVNFDGTALASNGYYAFSVLGTAKATEGLVPEINIGSTAIIGNGTTNMDGIYAAGYGIWNIKGSITGKTGIYAKAGIINLDGATINANGEYSDVVAVSSGYQPTGDGITIDSKLGYCGNMELNIKDATINSTNAYAIREELSDEKTSNTIRVSIEDGTYIGNADKGAVYYSEDLIQSLKDGSSSERWIVNGIKGGSYSSNPLVTADGYVVVESASGATPFTVKEAGATPQPGEKVYITSVTTVEDKTVPANTEIIVQDGAKYTVTGALTVTNDLSKVTVQPGGTLIAGSIVSNDASKFVVESDLTNGTGVVKYSDGVVTSPKGTVQLALHARVLDAQHAVWQQFGIPTTSDPDVIKSIQVAYKDWDHVKGWQASSSASLNAPFVGHEITVNTTAEGEVITFEGSLVTNEDQEITITNGYNALANSYTAPMSMKALVNSFDELLADGTTDGLVWVYDPTSTPRGFKKYNKGSFVGSKPDVSLPSMQAFFLGNYKKTDATFDLSYASTVLNYNPTTKDGEVAEYNSGIIKVSDGSEFAELSILEGEEFSDDYEPGYDGDDMGASTVKMYIVSGSHNLVNIATNSIEGKIITIVTSANTEYTLTFSELENDGFALYDITNPEDEKQVKVSEGGTYTFTAPASQTVQYFRLGEGHLTGAEEAEATELNFWVNENTLYVAGAESDIVVYNAAGVKVAAAKADGNAIQAVNIAGLAGGLYIVESGALTGKFIK